MKDVSTKEYHNGISAHCEIELSREQSNYRSWIYYLQVFVSSWINAPSIENLTYKMAGEWYQGAKETRYWRWGLVLQIYNQKSCLG